MNDEGATVTAYETVKLARKTGGAITVEMLDAAVEEQKATVSRAAILLGTTSGERMATTKLSPFPVEGPSLESLSATLGEEVRKLSKLVYFRAKVAAGESIHKAHGADDAGE